MGSGEGRKGGSERLSGLPKATQLVTQSWNLTPGLPIPSPGLYRLHPCVNETRGQMCARSGRTDDQGLAVLSIRGLRNHTGR